MKTEVEIQGKYHLETRRRKLNPMTKDLVVRDCSTENIAEIPCKKFSLLVGRLGDMEEENKILKELLAKKDDELHSSIIMCSKTASKLSQFEAQLGQLANVQKPMDLGQLANVQKPMELALFNPISNEPSLTSSYNVLKDIETSNSATWASALISELEHFRSLEPESIFEHKSVGVSEMSLMDDFAEMEKLAVVAVDVPPGTIYPTSDVNHLKSESLQEKPCEDHLKSTGKELVPAFQSKPSDMDQELITKGYHNNWIADVLNVILEQSRVSKRSTDELLEDVRIALHQASQRSASKAYGAESFKHPASFELLPISGFMRSPHTSPRAESIEGISHIEISVKAVDNEILQSNLYQSISKILGLIRSLVPTCSRDCHMSNNWSERRENQCKDSMTPGDISHYQFQWKSCELSRELEQFIQACNDILDGKVDFEKFTGQLSCALGCMIDNCVGFEDASLSNKASRWKSSFSPSVTDSSGQHFMLEAVKDQYRLQEQYTGLSNESKNNSYSQNNLEMKQESANNKSKALITKLQESEQMIRRLQNDLKTLKETKTMIEDEMENLKTINEDLDTQLTVAKVKLNEAFQKLSSLEVELEDRNHCYEELEATCLELQLQLESIAKKETPNDSREQLEGVQQTGWETTAASAKLVECQETIFNLEKKFKSLASPKEAAVFDKVISATTASKQKLSQHSSLRDQMLPEDHARTQREDPGTQMMKESTRAMVIKRPPVLQSDSYNNLCILDARMTPAASYLGSKHEAKTAAFVALATMPSNKRGRISLLRKLLFKRKRWLAKKTCISIDTMNCGP